MTLLGLLSGLFIVLAMAALSVAATMGQRHGPVVLPTRRSLRIVFLVAMATGLGLIGSVALLQGWAGVLRAGWPLLQVAFAAGLLTDLPWREQERLQAGAGGRLLGTAALALAVVSHALTGIWAEASFAVVGLSILSSLGSALETRALRRASARQE